MGDAFIPIPIRRRQGQSIYSGSVLGEARIWSSMRKTAEHALQDPVTDVCFSPQLPHELAAAHGFSVSLINPDEGSVRKTVTRFRSFAYSPHFKEDGRLMVCGCGDGSAQVFDVANRSVLRTFKGHTGSVRTAKFGNGLRVLTGSDDSTVKVWDLPTSTRLFSLTDSTDYVRSQSSSPASMHIWMTGSADRKARIYDLRTRKPIIVLDHGSQVDDVCILPGGVRAVTIGGPYVKVWDFLNGGKVLHTPFSHSKGVTCGAVNVRNNSLATAGLDGFMKVYDLATFRAKGSMSFGGQILSMAVSGDGGRYAVGTNEGNVEVRSVGRKSHAVNNSKHVSPFKERDFEGWGRGVTRVDEPSGPFPGSRRYFERGAGVKPSQDDLVVRKNRKLKLAEYDKHLKKFEVGLALDEALNEGSPGVVVAVVEELTVRGVLNGALAGREVEDLLPMLGVIRRHVRNPTYTDRLVYFLNVILDMYGGEFGRHEMADKELSNVLKEVKAELKTCIEMNCLRGTVELIIASV